ncbi:hypothetical protein C8R47DRAFT_1090776 [Mycena vitilis]|nr:hypothetical protein C8R47DRAFT_1090776 [Mycena vitilis]
MKHDCPLCGQLFRRLGALVTHMKRHQGPIGPIHKCDLCGQPFIRPSALKKHLKRHEEGFCKKPRPKHRCNICEKEFLRPSALETHLNMHYNRQPFKCALSECPKTFTARSNAIRHMHMHGLHMAPLDVSASTL